MHLHFFLPSKRADYWKNSKNMFHIVTRRTKDKLEHDRVAKLLFNMCVNAIYDHCNCLIRYSCISRDK